MSYKVYLPVPESGQRFSDAEYWFGEEFEEHVALCDHQSTTPLFTRMLPTNGRILEAGCGIARWVIYFRKLGYDITGLDNNTDALKRAKAHYSSLPLVAGDVRKTCFADNTFDAVLCTGVVEHFEQGPQTVLNEIHRILKPGGLLLVGVPYNNVLRRLVTNRVLGLRTWRFRTVGHELEFVEHRYCGREMQRFLDECGFDVTSIEMDELALPKSIGLYVDYFNCTFKATPRKWELPRPGLMLAKILNFVSPWISCGAIVCVATAR